MRFHYLATTAMLFTIGLFGCDREPAPAPPTANSSAATPSPSPAAVAGPEKDVAPTLAKAQPAPEDATVDAEREAKVRAKAKELDALPVIETKNLADGAEVYVLVRGDKGGGTIYGSGPYTADSQLRRAAIHAGAVKDRELGIVKLKYAKHKGDHPSVPANGIVPTKWGEYGLSYTIEKVEVP